MVEEWKEFFTSAAGASATLVGLVIVAVSVNVQRILEHPQLPSRSGATVAALVLILVSSLAELIPQPIKALAIENISVRPISLVASTLVRAANPGCLSKITSGGPRVGDWNRD
jgi:hypothetical protein